jgi:hypothetical protein
MSAPVSDSAKARSGELSPAHRRGRALDDLHRVHRLHALQAQQLDAVGGVDLDREAVEQRVEGAALLELQAGIRKANRRDLCLISLLPGARVAGVFTVNRFCAAPVQVCRDHLSRSDIRALVINTGIANAGTGEPGLVAARATCDRRGRRWALRPNRCCRSPPASSWSRCRSIASPPACPPAWPICDERTGPKRRRPS